MRNVYEGLALRLPEVLVEEIAGMKMDQERFGKTPGRVYTQTTIIDILRRIEATQRKVLSRR